MLFEQTQFWGDERKNVSIDKNSNFSWKIPNKEAGLGLCLNATGLLEPTMVQLEGEF